MHSVVEAFLQLKGDLESERRAMERIWTKRERQIDAAALDIAGPVKLVDAKA